MSAHVDILNKAKTERLQTGKINSVTVCTGAFCSIKNRAENLGIIRELKIAAKIEMNPINITKTDCLGLCSKSPAIRVGNNLNNTNKRRRIWR